MTKLKFEPIKKYFLIIKGNANHLSQRKPSNSNNALPLITSSANNDGISMFTDPYKKDKVFKNVITINNSGSVGIVFYHPYSFIASGHVTILELKNYKMNAYIGFYLKATIEKQRKQFSFGYAISNERLNKLKINLPITDNGKLDIKYMVNSIKPELNKINNSYQHFNITDSKYSLTNKKWKFFQVKDVFDDIKSGRHYPQRLRKVGKYPFISSSISNNGVTDFVSPIKTSKVHENAISVSSTGSIGYAYYHQGKFLNDRNVHILFKQGLTFPIAIFLCTCIKQQQKQFEYGFILKTNRLWNLRIKLPINQENKPDYDFMNKYIKSLISK